MRHKYALRFLLAVSGVGGAVWLFVEHDILAFTWNWVLASGRWIVEFARPLLGTFAIRRAVRPFWRLLFSLTWALVGGSWARRIRRFHLTIAASCRAWWTRQHPFLKFGSLALVLIAGAFFGLGVFVAPLWLPLLFPIVRVIRWWGFDQVVDRRFRPVQLRWRRFVRVHMALRMIRGPWRAFVLSSVREARRVHEKLDDHS